VKDIEPALIARAVHGDPAACRELIESLERPVFSTIHRFLGRRFRTEAEDIAQDIFLKVFRSLDHFDPRRGVKFTTWVFAFVRNHCVDLLKRKRLDTVSLTGDGESGTGIDVPDAGQRTPGEHALDAELGLRIEDALQSLTEDQRATFVLREYEGLDYAEIAHVMDTSEGTVKSRLSRARETLRQRLDPYLRARS
jgi:RNA polymerase sigma-70 factor (ECF subfamily)